MKILIDIGHPAHVHYFKNFIKIMKNKNHNILIIARDKDVTFKLLNSYNYPFISRGKGGKGAFSKLLYLFKENFIIYKDARKFKPDIILSFGSPYVAIASKLLRKPHIIFNDTEHAKLSHLISDPFSQCILTPSPYNVDLGKKQIYFSGYMELCYLHPNYFKPDPSILDLLQVKNNEKYIIMRFVSWNASHDVGHSGLSIEMKHKAVKELSKYANVFISSEGELPNDLKKYQLKIPPNKMHDALAFADLFIGEGATMASECACLGTTAIYVNSLNAGTIEEQEKYELLFSFRNSEGVFEKAIVLLNTPNLKKEFQKRRSVMLTHKIDVTAFMVWFVENYPKSFKIMKDNPGYQYKFN